MRIGLMSKLYEGFVLPLNYRAKYEAKSRIGLDFHPYQGCVLPLNYKAINYLSFTIFLYLSSCMEGHNIYTILKRLL